MRDEVDELLEAWGRERADLDLAPVAVFSRVSRLARRLELARRDAFATHGIEQWEFDVLAALRRAGAPYELSPGRLLRETLVTSGTMTNRIDRLSARGLVERHPDPDDRRGVIVRLTTEGRPRSTPRSPHCWRPSARCSRISPSATARGSRRCCAPCSPRSTPRRASTCRSTTT